MTMITILNAVRSERHCQNEFTSGATESNIKEIRVASQNSCK